MDEEEQFKQPTEDLEVHETSCLPSLAALGWVRLPADAFSNLLMVVEFTHSFKELLNLLNLDVLPPLDNVYLALYNWGRGQVLMELCSQLFKEATYDPCEKMCVYVFVRDCVFMNVCSVYVNGCGCSVNVCVLLYFCG